MPASTGFRSVPKCFDRVAVLNSQLGTGLDGAVAGRGPTGFSWVHRRFKGVKVEGVAFVRCKEIGPPVPGLVVLTLSFPIVADSCAQVRASLCHSYTLWAGGGKAPYCWWGPASCCLQGSQQRWLGLQGSCILPNYSLSNKESD